MGAVRYIVAIPHCDGACPIPNNNMHIGETPMPFKSALIAGSLFVAFCTAWADLQPFTDYDASDAVYLVTTVKVDSNMGDAYLEGLKATWVPGNEIAKELGQIEDYAIYRSDLPASGEFNLILVVKLASAADMQPSKERYDTFMEEYGRQASDEATEFAQQNYPAMRELTGSYMMREITIK